MPLQNSHLLAHCSGPAMPMKPRLISRVFQQLTSTKVSFALGLSYGDQGHYSTVVAVAEPITPAAMIPVQFKAVQLPPSGASGKSLSGGTCMIDADGDGIYDLVLMQSGASAIRILRSNGKGSLEPFEVDKAGLTVSGQGISCAAGDVDGDGLSDLIVAMEDRIILFHNQGHGHFSDVNTSLGHRP